MRVGEVGVEYSTRGSVATMRAHLLTSRMSRKPLKGFYFGDVWVNACTREEQNALAEEMVRRWNDYSDLSEKYEALREELEVLLTRTERSVEDKVAVLREALLRRDVVGD